MIYIGADHRGYELKEKLKTFLGELGYDYEDMGAFEYNKDDDYPDFAKAVAEKVVQGGSNKGILICGSDIGMAAAANKIKGIRAGGATIPEQVAAAVHDDNINVLSVSADFVDEIQAEELIKTFLETKFGGDEKYVRRINKIKELEK